MKKHTYVHIYSLNFSYKIILFVVIHAKKDKKIKYSQNMFVDEGL